MLVALRSVGGLIKVASCVSQISFWQRRLTPTARRIWPACPLGASVLMNPSISRLANTIHPNKATIGCGHSRFKLLKKRQRATQNLESSASIQIYPVKYKSLLMSNISVKLVKHGNALTAGIWEDGAGDSWTRPICSFDCAAASASSAQFWNIHMRIMAGCT